MFRALTYELSLDDALDLEEIDEVSRSWRDAAQADAENAPKNPSRRGRGRVGAMGWRRAAR